MERRMWETPRTLSLGELAQSFGICANGSTATLVSSGCTAGNEPKKILEVCSMGGLAAGTCVIGATPFPTGD